MKKIFMLGVAMIAISAAQPARADLQQTSTTTTTTNSSQNYEYAKQDHSRAPLDGFYAGVYGGYSWNDADTNTTNSVNADGWDGGVFVGYKFEHLVENIGMSAAVELSYGNSNADDTVGTIKVEKDNDWGLSFRPGFDVVDNATRSFGFTPYGIVGWRLTEFDTSGATSTGDSYHNGFELGAGAELAEMNGFGIRAEYSHVWYGDDDGVDPDSNNVRLGLAYHF